MNEHCGTISRENFLARADSSTTPMDPSWFLHAIPYSIFLADNGFPLTFISYSRVAAIWKENTLPASD
ncbi:MAG: hypothetical protein WKI04_20085 [Ferruginibacter sp.]